MNPGKDISPPPQSDYHHHGQQTSKPVAARLAHISESPQPPSSFQA
jgi:hypothetical protein